MVPVLGEAADLLNAGIHVARGNFGEAAVSAAAMVPFLGAAVPIGKLAGQAGRLLTKNADKLDEATAALAAVARKTDDITSSAVTCGWGNMGSHGPIDPNLALRSADKWLGPGYNEIASGVFRSADELRQFRMTSRDLIPTHGNIGPHVHFEALNSAGDVIENLHLPVLP